MRKKMVDKVVENLTQGRWIPIDSVKSENYFKNFDRRIGDTGHIESDKPNPAYIVCLCLFVKYIAIIIFSILIWIHISSRPHLTQITPTRLFTTWTNHLGRILFIRLNMTHTPNPMTIIFKIFTLYRVNGDSPPPSQISVILSIIFAIFIPQFCFLYSFFITTNRRKIWIRKEYGSCTSHDWVPTK